MQHLPRLFRFLEITRAQPQYGYTVAEISKSDLSDLAQHHYLVTFIAWQLGTLLENAGRTVDMRKILELSLIHDLGELFGGDIAMPYAKANPKARTLAKAFEAENLRYLGSLFGKDEKNFTKLSKETMEPKSLEAVVAKIADYIEVTQYKLYVHRLSKNDIRMATKQIKNILEKVEDKKSRRLLESFVTLWAKELGDGKLDELFEAAKD